MVQPFKISIPDSRIQDLKSRLALAKFPSELDGAGWEYGVPLKDLERLTKYWRDEYDWRKAEQQLNDTLPQFTTDVEVDNGFGKLNVHFVHMRSQVKGALPLLFCHGWPGSFIEVSKIIHDLVKGGDDSPAFHVIAISMPNYGFSECFKKKGASGTQYGEVAHKVMLQLGYNEYVYQGGDWGWGIGRVIARDYPQHCKATHFNTDSALKPTWLKNPILSLQHALTPYSKREKEGMARTKWFIEKGSGYFKEHSTKPQTIGYALEDSPVALLAWIYEKLHDWTDSYPWTEEEVCTWVSIYWFSKAGAAASVRIYYETQQNRDLASVLRWLPDVKVGVSHFPKDLRVVPRSWTRTLGPLVFNEYHPSGGHFAAWERPEVIVGDMRKMFGKSGGAYNVLKGKDGYAE